MHWKEAAKTKLINPDRPFFANFDHVWRAHVLPLYSKYDADIKKENAKSGAQISILGDGKTKKKLKTIVRKFIQWSDF